MLSLRKFRDLDSINFISLVIMANFNVDMPQFLKIYLIQDFVILCDFLNIFYKSLFGPDPIRIARSIIFSTLYVSIVSFIYFLS